MRSLRTFLGDLLSLLRESGLFLARNHRKSLEEGLIFFNFPFFEVETKYSFTGAKRTETRGIDVDPFDFKDCLLGMERVVVILFNDKYFKIDKIQSWFLKICSYSRGVSILARKSVFDKRTK